MRLRYNIWLTLVLGTMLAGSAYGQGNVVQLPQFSFFTVATTVSVPDRGSALLGGVKRSSSGRVERGVPLVGKLPMANRLFNNRAIGRDDSSALMHVTAYIHDHDEMDRAILAAAARRRGATVDVLGRPVDYGGRRLVSRPAAANHGIGFDVYNARREVPQRVSADTLARRSARFDPNASPDARAARFLNLARAAQSQGNDSLARLYYRNVVRLADGEVRQLAQARLDELDRSGSTPVFSTGE